jgi:hypothetical protein
MTKLDAPLAAGQFFGAGRQDAYMRILNWEATVSRRRTLSRLERYRLDYLYYTGDNMPPGQFIQPLAINYLRATCESHASYLWGQWESQNRMVNWTVTPRDGKGNKETLSAVEQWLYHLFDGREELLYVAGLNQSIFGDCILRPRWDYLTESIVPESVLPEYFYAKWSAHDVTDLQEVIISYPIDRMEADAEFGTIGDAQWASATLGHATQFAIYWEYWTRHARQVWIDNKLISEEPNPIGFEGYPGEIPFVHIPNVRSGGEFYGNSDIASVKELQDELNRKMADLGDIISYSAHPIVLIKKYFGKVAQLPVGPDAMWDMGRDGEAEYLGGGTPPVDINKYIATLLETFQDLSYMPAAAFGRSENTQSTALAMAMEMMPVTQRVNIKRLHWKTGLTRYAHMAAIMAERKGVLPFSRKEFLRYYVDPNFASVLPKDRATSVNENVALVTNGLRTIKRALDDLGERDSAKQALEIIAEIEAKLALGMRVNIGGMNSRGPGGSPDTGAQAREDNSIKTEGK